MIVTFYVKNINFLIDLRKIGYGQILSFSDHGPYYIISLCMATCLESLEIMTILRLVVL